MEQQLNNLTLAYAPKDLANVPRKIKSDITREMIDDYEAELDKEKIFQPASLIPVLETPVLNITYSTNDLNYLHQGIHANVDDIKNLDERIVKKIERIELDKEEFNAYVSNLDLQIVNSKKTSEKRQLSIKKKEVRLEHEKIQNDLLTELKALEFQKNNLETINHTIQKDINQNNQIIQENAGELERVRKINQQNLKSVEDELRALNQGFSINQSPGESEEDYLKRIQSMKDTKYSIGVQTDAEVYNYKKLKKRLKEIVNVPDFKLSNVIKMLEKDTLVYEANKKFPFVKSHKIGRAHV